MKDIFYHEFLDGSNNLDATEHMPKLWYLLQNFRTHAGIINLANSVVDLIMRFFPLSIDRMQPEASRVYGPLPIVLSDSSDFLGLFQKSTMHSCEFGAEQAILVRDEDTKRSVLEVSGNRALVLTVLEAKGMEFTDCLVYNFFGTSPLGNDWRVIYSQMETNEAHPEFNIQRHNLLCVELKLLYVLVTRARQHLLILDDSPTLMKPILDFWKLQNLVEMRDLDENIRAMFQSSSTPEEWRQRAEQLFERKQYGNARLCYQRAGDEYQERLCSSFEVEQEADNCVVRKPAEAKMLYKSAYESFKGLTGHMADAARCCEKAAEWLLAAEIYNKQGKFSQAGKCFEKKDAWTDAAIAYDRAQEYSDALRCCYKGYQFELALGFLGNMRISGKVPAEDVAKGENECNKKAALFYHANRDSNKMMEYVSRFSSTQEKRDFLKRYKYFEKLLDVEIADKCFQEAATVYEGLYNFEKAADLYEQGQLYGDMCRCVIRRLRCKYLGEDFTLNPLDDGDKALLEDISGKYLHTGKCSDSVYYQIEVDVLYALSGQPCVGESVAVNTSRNVAPPECVSNIPRSEHTLKSLYKRCEDLGDKTWRLQFHIVRCAVATSLAKKDWREAKVWCEKLDTIVVAVTRLLDKICQSNNVPRLSSVDKEILNHCLSYFELGLEGTSVMATHVSGPSSVVGLVPVFSLPAIEKGARVLPMKMSLKEFAQRARIFFKKRGEKAISDWLKCYLECFNTHKKVMYSETCDRYLVPKDKRPQLELTTDMRYQMLLALYDCTQLVTFDSIQQSNSGPNKHDVKRKLTAECISLVLPSTDLVEDLIVVQKARKDPKIRAIVQQYILSELSQPGLRYQAIAFTLLLADAIGDSEKEANRLQRIITSEFRKLNYAEVDPRDHRMNLVQSYLFQYADFGEAMTCGFQHGSFLLSVLRGFNSIMDDLWNGATNNLIFLAIRSNVLKQKHGCYSPSSFLKFTEKYFLFLLLHMKSFRGTVVHSRLATDVLCRINQSYADVIEFHLKAEFGELASARLDSKFACIVLARKLIRLLSELNQASLKEWYEFTSSGTGNGDKSGKTMQFSCVYFLTHLVELLLQLIVNMSPQDRYRVEFCSHLSAAIQRNPIFAILPPFYLNFIRSVNFRNAVSTSANFFKTYGNSDQLVYLSCLETEIPKFVRYAGIPLRILCVQSDCDVCILSHEDAMNLGASNSGSLDEGTIPVSIVDTEEISYVNESEIDNIDPNAIEEFKAMDFLHGAAAPSARISREEKRAQAMEKFYERMRVLAKKAKVRLSQLSDVESHGRHVEQEFIALIHSERHRESNVAFAMGRKEEYVQTYIETVAPQSLRLQKDCEELELSLHAATNTKVR